MAAFDEVDLKILEILEKNSRITWKEIGSLVHMTGQAVAARIDKLEELGILEGYTVKINRKLLGSPIIALVTVFMKTTNHASFHNFIHSQKEIIEAFRISGEGCYSLKIMVPTQADLVELLDRILSFGNYKVKLSIEKIK
ncbi:Lrp/AsnC family transcriptional regulator [Neobacillus pocheonensis]|uniref:Lrp/AsnC family transcriptional regulator n=1 Tax=Neobacillus pocheonensis TaxID=363869 RepID=UPI003D29D73E